MIQWLTIAHAMYVHPVYPRKSNILGIVKEWKNAKYMTILNED